MSKTKKIISMILVTAMVLSAMPLAGITNVASASAVPQWRDSAAASSGVSATVTATEVIRVNQKQYSVFNGTQVCAATASGMPQVSGSDTMKAAAYAGESLITPSVTLTLNNGAVMDSDFQPTLTVSALSGTVNCTNFSKSGGAGQSTVTWTYAVDDLHANIASAGAYALYTIQYKVNGTLYTSYGVSNFRDITNPAGFVCNHVKCAGTGPLVGTGGDWYTRTVAMMYLQADNMYATLGYADKGTPNAKGDVDGSRSIDGDKHCYINFSAATVTNSPSSNAADFIIKQNSNTTGIKYPALMAVDECYDYFCTDFNVGWANDKNRNSCFFYVDRSKVDGLNDPDMNLRYTLFALANSGGKGTYPFSIYNGGFCVSTTEGTQKLFNTGCVITAWPVSDTEAKINECTYLNNLTASQINMPCVPDNQSNGFAWTDTRTNTNYTNAQAEAAFACGSAAAPMAVGQSRTWEIFGTGPTALSNGTPTYWLFEWEIEGHSASSKSSYAGGGSTMRWFFFNTNKGELRALVNQEMAANRQAANYTTSSWNTYYAAYTAAMQELCNAWSKNQNTVTSCVTNLTNAVNGLQKKTGKVTVNFYEATSYTSENPVSVYPTQVRTTRADGTTLYAGDEVYCIPPEIAGYTVVGDAAVNYEQHKTAAEDNSAVIDFLYNAAQVQFAFDPVDPAAGEVKYKSFTYNASVNLKEQAPGFTLSGKEIAGWYESRDCSGSPVTTITVPATGRTYYAKWQYAPVYINYNISAAGGATMERSEYRRDESTGAALAVKPADPVVPGYGFLGWYADANFTTPYTFGYINASTTIYGKFESYDGQIKFNSNGGSTVNPIDLSSGYTAGQTVNLAVPTKVGYNFAGWYLDSGLTNSTGITGSGSTWTYTLPDIGGCMMYAKWVAKDIQVNFYIGNSNPSPVDTTINPLPIHGKVGASIKATVDADDTQVLPNDPIRYGYDFAGWYMANAPREYNAWTFDTRILIDLENGVFPDSDTGSVKLYPVWVKSSSAARIDIDTYKAMYGELVSTEGPDGLEVTEGDTVTVHMTPTTNFNAGAMTLIYMYDSTFFELVGDGSSAFSLNPDNKYVVKTGATCEGYVGSLASMWPDELSSYSTNYKWIQVTVSPDVSSDEYGYPEILDDGSWLVEFKLRVKSNVDGAQGTVFMDEAWTRSDDSVSGIQFIGYCKNAVTPVWEAFNNTCQPILTNATSTVTYTDNTDTQSTVTLNPANGNLVGKWGDNSTGTKSFTGDCGEKISDTPAYSNFAAPTLTGYTLTEWVNVNDESDKWIEGYFGAPEQNGQTYKAVWTPNEYDITFNANGGKIGDKNTKVISVAYDSEYNLNGRIDNLTVTKAGYALVGWATTADATAEDVVDLSTAIKTTLTDETYYAVWDVAPDTNFAVKVWYPNSADSMDELEYASVTKNFTGYTGATAHVVTDKTGLVDSKTDKYISIADLGSINRGLATFDPNNRMNADLNAEIKDDGTTVINVYYKLAVMTVTFDPNGGTFSGYPTAQSIDADGQGFSYTAENDGKYRRYVNAYSQLVVEGEGGHNYLPDTNPAKEGYDFKGWARQATATTPVTTFSAVNNSTTVYYAVYAPKSADITFDANGGLFGSNTTYGPVSVNVGANVTAPKTAPTRTGYTLVGYNTNSAATTNALPEAVSSQAAKTYYAIWTPALQNVTVQVMKENVDGSYATTTSTVQGYTENSAFSVDPADYAEEGFTYNSAASTNSVALTSATAVTPAVITLKFTRNSYNATFALAGGNIGGSTADITNSLKYGAAVTAPGTPVKEGYTFKAWSPEVDETMPAHATTYTATYDINYNNVSFYVDYKDGNGYIIVSNPTPTAYNADIALPADPTVTGYTFTGWSTTQNAATPEIAKGATAKMPDAEKVYYSVFTANTYDATFDLNGGNIGGNTANVVKTTAFDTVIENPGTPEKTGYTFTGWTPAFTAGTTVMDDVNGKTFTAVWTANAYAVKYDLNGGNVNGSTTVADVNHNFGSQFYPDYTPVKTGYTFTGWTDSATSTTVAATSQYILNSLGTTFTANWTADTNVKYVVNTYTMDTEGKSVSDGGITYRNGTADASKTIEVTVPTGFELREGTVLTKTIAADGTTTFDVYLDRISYTLIYKDYDGSEISSANVLYGASISSIDDPTRTGYTFAGWNWSTGTAPEAMPAYNVTATATYTINSYKATFALGGGNIGGDTADVEITYNYGAAITAPTGLVKTGYTFKEWSPAVDATMPAESKTYTATWTANKYPAKFYNADNTTEFTTEQIDYDSEITVPGTTPAKDGYDFQGWALTAGGDKLDSLGIMDDVNGKEFYPVFTAKTNVEYTVNAYYQNADGTWPTEPTVHTYTDGVVDQDITPINTASTDYARTGFTPDKATLTGTVPATGKLVIEVRFSRITKTLTINPNRGEFSDDHETASRTVTLRYGEELTLPAVERTGYTQSSWNVNGATQAVGSKITMGLEDITATAIWSANAYDVVWNANQGNFDGEATFTTSANFGSSISDAEVTWPVREGYDCVGWAATADGEALNDLGTQVVGGKTFYAVWEAIEYTVQFDLDGGTRTGGGQTTQTIAYGAAITAPTATKTGYTFKNWSPAIPETMPACDDLVFTAIWDETEVTYTVNTYIMGTDGKYPATPETAKPAAKTNAEVDATPVAGQGFTLDTAHLGYQATGKVAADGSLVLTIYIARNTYTFTTVIEGVNVDKTYYFEETLDEVATPEKTGYTFDNWYSEATYDNVADIPATMPADNVTVYAKLDINDYTVSYVFDGAPYGTADTFNFDADVTVKALPTKTGYTVTGWTWTKEDGTAASEPAKMPAYNLVATATSSINTYTITYTLDGAKLGDDDSYTYGADVTARELPTKTGYTVTGWTWSTTDGKAPATMPADNITAAATSTVNSYKLKFTVDGQLYGEEKDVNYGTAVAGTALVPAAPTKAGYTFSGWQNVPATMPDDAVTVTGTFSADASSYAVETYTMDTNGDYKLTNSETVTDGVVTDKKITITAPAADAGFTFNAEKSVLEGTVPATGKLTLKVYYDRNKYEVVFNTFEGQTTGCYSDYYGKAVVAPSDPIRVGYTFGGWAATADGAKLDDLGTVKVGGNTYYAKWTINKYTVTFVVPTFNEATRELDTENCTTFKTVENVAYNTNLVTIVPDGTPTVNSFYTFKTWDFGGNVTMPANNITVYATFDRVDVDLAIKGTSSTIIDTVDEDGGYVYGLQTKLVENTMRSTYVDVDGDGYYKVEPVSAYASKKLCGTGTAIKLYDNFDDSLVAVYYVVIYGDVNGDSSVSSVDRSMIQQEIVRQVKTWSIVEVDEVPANVQGAMLIAADLNADGNITTVDATAITEFTTNQCTFNQDETDRSKSKIVYSA